MMSTSSRLRGFLALAAAFFPASAQVRDPFEPTIGTLVGDQLSNAARSYQDLQRNIGGLSATVAAARARYWRAFSSGQGLPEAQAEFQHQLLAKDMLLLAFALPDGLPEPLTMAVDAGTFSRASVMAALVNYNAIDGGIRPLAYPAFKNLVASLRYDMGARRANETIFFNPVAMMQAMLGGSNPAARTYIRARDWAEFMASGLDVRKYLQPGPFSLLLIESRLAREAVSPEVKPPDVAETAAKIRRLMVDAVGEKAVADAAEKVLAVPKGPLGELATPVAIQTRRGMTQTRDTYRWFEALMEEGSSRGYAISLLKPLLGDLPYRWENGTKNYRELMDEFSECIVHQAAEQIRFAPRAPSGMLGANKGWPESFFRQILNNPNVKLPGPLQRFDATDFAGIKSVNGDTATVRGIVESVSGSGERRTIRFRGSPKVSGIVVDSDLLADAFRGTAFEGKLVEITADQRFSVNNPNAAELWITSPADQIKFVNATDTPMPTVMRAAPDLHCPAVPRKQRAVPDLVDVSDVTPFAGGLKAEVSKMS